MTDRVDMLIRFDEFASIGSAISLMPTKNIIVFCHYKDMYDIIQKLLEKNPSWVFDRINKMIILPSGMLIKFANSYARGRGIDRNTFVMVDML
jgi:hypothetical protein